MGKFFDVYLPLDADEFPIVKNIDDFIFDISQIPDGFVGVYEWETYVPIQANLNDFNQNGMQNCFKRRLPEGLRNHKVVIPFSRIADLRVGLGGHEVFDHKGALVPKWLMKTKLAHFPVRSALQIIRKNITAVNGLMRKTEKSPGEGLHVYLTLKLLRDSNFIVSIEYLQKLAKEYANNADLETVLADESISWIPDYTLKYTGNYETSVISTLSKLLIESWESPVHPNQLTEFSAVMNLYHE
jgi:hypothetical protein